MKAAGDMGQLTSEAIIAVPLFFPSPDTRHLSRFF